MKHIPIVIALILASCGASTFAQDAPWKAAAATVVITPDEPMWMAGYASRTKPSEGKAQDLFAKALAVEDADGARFVVVTTDLLGITPELRNDVVRQVQKSHHLPDHALLMNASHTHCGPEIRHDMILQRNGTEAFATLARDYTKKIATRIAQTVGRALDNLQPASLTYSYARAGFAMNRRLPVPNGPPINSPYPDGPVDHQVPVLRVDSAKGDTLAVMFGYACHNTTLGFQLFCGDYAGFAQQYIEDAHPGAVALFMTGCGGDQNPYPRRTLELAQRHGRSLATAVEAALETRSTREVRGSVRSALENVTLEFATPPTRAELVKRSQDKRARTAAYAKRLLALLDRDGALQTEYVFPLQAVQFGEDLTLVALCGESVVDYSLRLKRELRQSPDNRIDSPGPRIWVAGYSNHVFGYLPSKRVLLEGGYEGGRAMESTNYPGPFAPSVEERVVTKVKELVRKVRARSE
ncbi:MAG: neutral/alkaline non-lysosomal ceramidase N-terminal domain-containing protein [Planctomycetota bacterium]